MMEEWSGPLLSDQFDDRIIYIGTGVDMALSGTRFLYVKVPY
jgi:hypothetical protein